MAADQGNPDALYKLGTYYFLAFDYFKKSAEKGNTNALCNLAFFL